MAISFGQNVFEGLQNAWANRPKPLVNFIQGVQARRNPAPATPAAPGEGSGVNWHFPEAANAQADYNFYTGLTPEQFRAQDRNVTGMWSPAPENLTTFDRARLGLWGMNPDWADQFQLWKNPETGRQEAYAWRNPDTGEFQWRTMQQAVARPGGYVGEGDDRKWVDPILHDNIVRLYGDVPEDWWRLGSDAAKLYQRVFPTPAGEVERLDEMLRSENPTSTGGQDFSWLQDLLGMGLLGMGASPSLSTGLSEDVLGMILSSMSQGQYQPEDLFGPQGAYGPNQQPMTVIPTF